MAWEDGYYYRKRRQGDKVISEYIGAGVDAELLAELDAWAQEQRQAQREAFRRLVATERATDREIDALGALVRNATTLVLVATGHRQHKRQWRKYREMTDTFTLQLTPPSNLTADELNSLIAAINAKHPTKKQRAEFMRHLTALPALAKQLGDAQEAITIRLLESFQGSQGSAGFLAATVHLDNLRKDLGYDDAPLLERMLIDHILIAWVRLQQAEWRNLNATLDEHQYTTGNYWERRLSSAQARYLRAVETLARVRRLNVRVQINMAHQQIVAGN